MKQNLSFKINGMARKIRAHPMDRLLDVLREQLELTGTKEGCGEGECGACSVIMNGQLVNSCLIPVLQADGATLTTIEGISSKRLSPLQESFLTCGGAQCGICTPGMIVAATVLLKSCARPKDHEIREYLSGNLCRCTGYQNIVESVTHAGKRGRIR